MFYFIGAIMISALTQFLGRYQEKENVRAHWDVPPRDEETGLQVRASERIGAPLEQTWRVRTRCATRLTLCVTRL